MRILIKGGLVIDPSCGLCEIADVLIEKDGTIKNIVRGEAGADDQWSPLQGFDEQLSLIRNIDGDDLRIIDAKGKWVVPGLVDLHAHFRDPGLTHKEDIFSGCEAAARGGVTTVCCMPNTSPIVDTNEIVRYILGKAKKANGVQLLVVGAITKGQTGLEIADVDRDICALSEDGKTVMNEVLMKAGMEKARKLNIPIFSHTEDHRLSVGSLHDGKVAAEYKLKGISRKSEENIVSRDIALANETGSNLHLCHISTKGSVALIRTAKSEGINVTAEVTPHHLTLTENDLTTFDFSKGNKENKLNTNKKMNPPLREQSDVDALIDGLRDGTIDAIATDHAPHQDTDKNVSFEDAPFGVTGLETSFAVSYTYLAKTGKLTPVELINKLSTRPGEILGGRIGTLKIGENANIAVFDINKEYVIRGNEMASKSNNTAFEGMKVCGEAICTIANGKIIYEKP